MSGIRGFWEYIQHQNPPILVSFRQNINFKQRTELTNGRRAENKSWKKQGFHLDAAQFLGTFVYTSALKLSCQENVWANGNRTLVLALPTAVSCKEMSFWSQSDFSHCSQQWRYLYDNQTAGITTYKLDYSRTSLFLCDSQLSKMQILILYVLQSHGSKITLIITASQFWAITWSVGIEQRPNTLRNLFDSRFSTIWQMRILSLWTQLRPFRLPRGTSCIIGGLVYHSPSAANGPILDYSYNCLLIIEARFSVCGTILLGDFNKT